MSGARAEEVQEDGRICLSSCTRMRMELMCALLVACWCAGAGAQYSSDQCSWRGSGLTHEAHARDVEQVYLRCSEGSLEWLYPTGAIIINLRPNTVPERSADAPMLACVKPRGDSRGSSLYVERAGVMRMLLSEEEQESRRVRCFRLDEGALFIQASVHSDISKRVTAFQYQLIRRTGDSPTDACRPCSDDEILMAACTSDFVVRGSIQSSVDDDDDKEQASLVLSVRRVFRQKRQIFRLHGRGRWSGRIKLPSHCGVRVGQRLRLGEFLFTGAVRFGEAWLSCAPRYRDFLQLYRRTAESGSNPCEIDVD